MTEIKNMIPSDRKRSNPAKPENFSVVGKQQPQAIELEMAVLGALLLEKDALARVLDIIKPEIFYKPAHKEIFAAIQSLYVRYEPVDILTVTEELRKTSKLELIGGAYYIAELTNRVGSAANIEHHTYIIAQKFLSRELIKICGDLSTQAYEDATDIFDLLDTAEKRLYELSGNNLRRDALPIDILTLKTLEQIQALRQKDEHITGVTSGFMKLDELTAGWQPADLIIVAARPSMGKTAFCLNIARNAALMGNKPVALFSLEMTATQIVQRMLCAEAELDANRIRTGRLEEYEWQQLNARIGHLSKAPITIDDTPGITITDLRAKCRRLKVEKDIQLIIIDYLQLMNPGNIKASNREQEIASISRALKQLAKELNVPIIALSQLNRSVETRGGDRRPMLSDLRESGSIEQDADVVIFLHRPEYYGLTTDEDGESTQGIAEIIIGKQRNGPVDKVKLRFIHRFTKFLNLDDGDNRPLGTYGNIRPAPPIPGTSGSGSSSVIFPSKINSMPTVEEDDFEVPF